MKTYKFNMLLAFLMCGGLALAQTKKLDKTYKTGEEVKVSVDARNTEVVIDYWDKNEVKVEAVLEDGKLSKEALQQHLKNWNLSAKATGDLVHITSSGRNGAPLPPMEVPLAELPEMMVPLQEMLMPLLENLEVPPVPPLPPAAFANIGKLNFDYEAYRKNGDKYLEKWEAQIEKSFGKEFEKEMEEWAKKFEQDTAWKRKVIVMEDMSDKMEQDMEKWEKKYAEEMEQWGERFGKQMEEGYAKEMEQWGAQFGKQMEAWAAQHSAPGAHPAAPKAFSRVFVVKPHEDDARRKLKITLPRKASLRLDVRYGQVDLQGNTQNLKARLSHTNFRANTIGGKATEIRADYTPVKVSNWNYGVLDASYAPRLELDKVRSIKLSSNSSDVAIQEILQDGIFRGSFGELVIDKLDPGFKSVDIVLENSDLRLDLPEAAYALDYVGTKSEVIFPKGLQLKSSTSYDTKKYQGYNKTASGAGNVNIRASFSDVLLD